VTGSVMVPAPMVPKVAGWPKGGSLLAIAYCLPVVSVTTAISRPYWKPCAERGSNSSRRVGRGEGCIGGAARERGAAVGLTATAVPFCASEADTKGTHFIFVGMFAGLSPIATAARLVIVGALPMLSASAEQRAASKRVEVRDMAIS